MNCLKIESSYKKIITSELKNISVKTKTGVVAVITEKIVLKCKVIEAAVNEDYYSFFF
jgi:non-canonical (house-cleaning) NTP pyrophosphatase